MKINYLKTVGFRKFKKEFETEIYDITSITGKNRSGKSNILYAIINIILGTNLSGNEKTCLINKKCDSSYGELHFTDNMGTEHTLVRIRDRYNNNKNFIMLDGKNVTQDDLINFYRDKKLFLSIVNPMYFLSKKTAEQKEMVDKYLSDIKPKTIFDTLSKEQQEDLIYKYFHISLRDIYHKLSIEELQEIYNQNNLKSVTGKEFLEIPDKDKWRTLCENIKELKDIKYYEMLSSEEKEQYINLHFLNIPMYIAYDKLDAQEKNILEGMPSDIPTYISELNDDIKKSQKNITSLDGKIEYAQKITDEELPDYKTFEKEMELSLARQELASLNINQDIVNKEKQMKIVNDLEKELLSKENEIKELDKIMKAGKKRYLEIKNGISSVCPTCEQHIQDESKNKTISSMRQDLTEKFDKKNIIETQIQDLKLRLATEKCKFYSLEGNTTIEKAKRIDVVEKTIKQLEIEQNQVEKFNNEISIKEQNIKNAKKDIAKFNSEKQTYNLNIDNLNKAKKTAQKLYISYIEEKMKLAKKYLKDVDIKFYTVLKTTGEIKEEFIITYKNNVLSDLSKSETIATALEFANMFNGITGANFPIFIDDYESCADYNFIKDYSSNTQIIISKVEKGKALKIADYNNMNNYTIIKPIINGYKTISINKNNKAVMQKAA